MIRHVKSCALQELCQCVCKPQLLLLCNSRQRVVSCCMVVLLCLGAHQLIV